MGIAVVGDIDLTLDLVFFRDFVVAVPGAAAVHADASGSLLVHGIAPVGHIDGAEALHILRLLIAGGGEDGPARCLSVGTLAGLLVQLEGNNPGREADAPQAVKQNGSPATVGAEGRGVGVVGGQKLRAAARAAVDPGVEALLPPGVLFHVIKGIGIIKAVAVVAFQLL